MNHEETVSFGQAVLKLNFDPGSPDDGMLTAECRLDHPFFVKNKGAKRGKNTVFPVYVNNFLQLLTPAVFIASRLVFILSKPYGGAPWDPML